MTERLYYDDSFLYEFDGAIAEILALPGSGRSAVILDRTAFYPTSGGQVFDTGWIAPSGGSGEATRCAVIDVADREDGAVLHVVESAAGLGQGMRVLGKVDAARRLDHIQQHSGQHVLSAAFIRLFDAPTVSFHMGDESCTIDLDTRELSAEQLQSAEQLANQIILQNLPVGIRYVTQEEALQLGLRKIPPAGKARLRLIAIQDFDLTACGGTHVRNTGQIGCILLRRTEKVRQTVRLEFVCGQRAVATARRDYQALSEAAELCSAHLWDLPQHLRKLQDDAKTARKSQERLLEELAGHLARHLVAEAPAANGRKVVTGLFLDRDQAFIRLLAQKCTRGTDSVVALLASGAGPAALVFAQSPGQPFDMGALMKEVLARLGGRGGGSKDLAQGGTESEALEAELAEIGRKLLAAQ
ncbi:MAG TPA: DHHA1 domain-containing protein [Candidatus Polarisedimenticolia bacterium]|nr:DHHA1 domain-containing protein [Candidatus Polarisedimenticolia bacterium]